MTQFTKVSLTTRESYMESELMYLESKIETLQPRSNISEHSTTLKLALLVADTPSPTVVETFGDYTRIFPEMLRRAISHSGKNIQIEMVNFDVTKMEYPTEHSDFQGAIVTGSACSASGDDPWVLHLNEYLKQLIIEAPKCKLVGICFGHQIIARAMGGTIEENEKGWEMGYTKLKLTNAGKRLFKTSKETLGLQQMHQDIITNYPPGFELLCSSDQCEVQVLMKPNHILTVQAHPEFSPDIIREVMHFFEKEGKFSKETANGVYMKSHIPDDGLWFAMKIVEFFMGNFVLD